MINKFSSRQFYVAMSILSAINLYVYVEFLLIRFELYLSTTGAPMSVTWGMLLGPICCLIVIPVIFQSLHFAFKRGLIIVIFLFNVLQIVLFSAAVLLTLIYGLSWIG